MKHKKLVAFLVCAAILAMGATGAVVFAQATNDNERPRTAFESRFGAHSLPIEIEGMDVEAVLAVMEGFEWGADGFDREALLLPLSELDIEILRRWLGVLDFEAMLSEFDFEALRAEIYTFDFELLRARLLELDFESLLSGFETEALEHGFELEHWAIRDELYTFDFEALRARFLELDFEAMARELDFEAIQEQLEADIDGLRRRFSEFDREALHSRFELDREEIREIRQSIISGLREAAGR